MRRTKAAIAATMIAALGILAGTPVAAKPQAPRASQRSASHAVSGLPVIPLTVRGHGRTHRFRVEVAATSQQQARGLMFRTAMPANAGMIFPMDPPREASFWMHNTVLPLDLIFIAPDNRILTIAARAVPYSDAQIPSGGVVKAVLELNGGRAASLGLRVGDKVTW